MTETKKTPPNPSAKLVAELIGFLEDSTMELRFRGCGDDHPLIAQAAELRRRLLTARADT